MQTTVARNVHFSGKGLHTGKWMEMHLRPAAANTGIRFRRVDIQDRENIIPAHVDAFATGHLRTLLANSEGVSISTIEHAMAAFSACGLDNALIDIDGPELPILHGNGLPFAEALMNGGLRRIGGKKRVLRVLRRVSIRQDGAEAALEPVDGDGFEIDFLIRFPAAAIGQQHLNLKLDDGVAFSELLPARTFILIEDVPRVRKLGLGLGGGLENTVVVDGARILNPGGLIFEDEFVRHKMMDALGDLYLCGCPIIGRFVGYCSGHELSVRLLRRLLADRQAWRCEKVPEKGRHEWDPVVVPKRMQTMSSVGIRS